MDSDEGLYSSLGQLHRGSEANQSVRYVVAEVKRHDKTHPMLWLVDLEEERIAYLSLDFSGYENPSIVKADLQFDGVNLVKVNFAISDRKYTLSDSQATFDLNRQTPKKLKEHKAVEILKLLTSLYTLQSVDVSY